MVQLNSNIAGAPDPQSRDALPAGTYNVVVQNTELVQNKARNGHYLKVTLSVLDSAHKNRKLFANYNVQNPSEQAVEIARSELKGLCNALGVSPAEFDADTQAAHGKSCLAVVRVEDNGYGPQNRVLEYKSAMGENAGSFVADKSVPQESDIPF